MPPENEGLKPTTTGQAQDAAATHSDDLTALIAQITADPTKTAQMIKELRAEAASNRVSAKQTAEALRLAQEAKAQEEATRKTQAEKELAEQGKFKTLAEQRTTELEQAKAEAANLLAYRKAFEAQLERRIAALPEAQRKLVPDFADPLKALAWLDQAEEAGIIGQRRAAPQMDAGAGNKIDPNQVANSEAAKAKIRRLIRF